jgi:uncharacterized membrane protein YidH (DUF202 family)
MAEEKHTTLSNTDLAFERTMLAYERTLMAWVRTAISLISFGFTLYKFLRNGVSPRGRYNRFSHRGLLE